MGCNEQNGFDLVNFTDLVQKKASYSNLVFSETAKVVVDIECSINLKDVSDLSNRASGLKAHLGEVGPCGLVQVHEGSEEYMGQVTPPTFGDRGAKGIVNQERGNCREGLKVSGSNVGRKVSSSNRTTGSKIQKGILLIMDRVGYNFGVRGGSVDDIRNKFMI